MIIFLEGPDAYRRQQKTKELKDFYQKKHSNFDFKKIGWDEPELEIILNPKDKINSSPEVKIKTQWLIIVECKDESEQIKILEKCLAEGWNCKAMSS